MVSNGDKLKQAIKLLQLIKSVSWKDESHIQGELSVNQSDINFLIDIDDLDLDLNLTKDDNTVLPVKLKIGDIVSVIFRCPRYPQAFFAKSFDDYLPKHDFKYKQPPLFYLEDSRLLIEKGTQSDDSLISSYQAVLELINIIETNELSDHHPSDPDRYFLFFGYEQKLRLSIEYSAQNLLNGSENIQASVKKLKYFIENGAHLEDKRLILKKTIIEVLGPHGASTGFSFLIENLPDFVNRVVGNFELYLGKYTFDNERQKLLIEIRDYFRSINDAISSAQLRLVAIPLTLLIAINKFEIATLETNVLSNVAVLIGVFIFSILMGRLTYSQKETLRAEKFEISSRKKQISDNYNELYKKLKEQFNSLDKRLLCQRNTLSIIDGSIILVSALSVFAFFKYNTHLVLSEMVLKWMIS